MCGCGGVDADFSVQADLGYDCVSDGLSGGVVEVGCVWSRGAAGVDGDESSSLRAGDGHVQYCG